MMMNKSIFRFALLRNFLLLTLFGVVLSCSDTPQTTEEQTTASTAETELVLASEVQWEQLNPARGDQSPKAGTLWGDRKGEEATGFLLNPVDGFSSPPHIHNVSYRGIVISGVIHNDDANAEKMWMPAGSFWTQPKGAPHITAAKGTSTLAYIEIEEGPYLVMPTEEAFDSGEEPVNVDESNIVWLDASNIKWIDDNNGAQIAYLWGTPQNDELNGTLIKLPAGFSGTLNSGSNSFKSVVIQGQPSYKVAGKGEAQSLEPGSYFASEGQAVHQLSTSGEVILYVRSEGSYRISATASK